MIKAHHILIWAEIFSPMHSSFNKSLLALCCSPCSPCSSAPLDVSPIVSIQQWHVERDANEQIQLQSLTFLDLRAALSPFVVCFYSMYLPYVVLSNMLLYAHFYCHRQQYLTLRMKVVSRSSSSTEAYLLELQINH